MVKKFKWQLMGYDPKLVNKNIEINDNHHLDSVKNLHDEYITLSQELEVLKSKIQTEKDNIFIQKKERENIEKQFFDSHMQDTKKIYDATEEANQMEKKKLEEVLEYENENKKLKASVKNLVKELHSKVEEYKLKFEEISHAKDSEDDGD